MAARLWGGAATVTSLSEWPRTALGPGLRRPPRAEVTVDIIRRNDSPQATDEQVKGLPGCGLAAYAGLLMVLCIVGMAGMAGGFIGVLFQEDTKGPLPLQPGTQTAVWALAPLRNAKLIRIDEIPLAYHAEQSDASVACALLEDRLVKVDGERSFTLPYASIREVTADGQEAVGVTVTAHGTPLEGGVDAVACIFQPMEGGEKFDRQLKSEAKRAADG